MQKQIKESSAIAVIRQIIKSGRTITNVKYNGQPSKDRYVMVEYIEPKTLLL